LTVLYCYDDGTGGLLTGSFTARASVDGVLVGSDGQQVDSSSMSEVSAEVISFNLRAAVLKNSAINTASMSAISSTLISLSIKSKIIIAEPVINTASMEASQASLDALSIVFIPPPEVYTEEQIDTASMLATSATLQDLLIKQTLITAESYGAETATMSSVSSALVTFTLG